MADGVVARLKILLGIDSAEVATGSRKAEREVSKMSKGISGAAKLATAALGAMGAALTVDSIIRVTRQALEYTTAIKAQARATGVSTQALQEYRYAALQAGLSNEDLADGFKDLTQKIGEAASGSKSAIAIFTDTGISIRDASGQVRDAADIMPELADAYNKLTSEAEKSAFAARVFGEDAGPKMKALLEQGSAGMSNYRAAARELGLVISEENIAKAEKAEKKMKALAEVLRIKVADTVSENADSISYLVDQLIRLAGAIGDVLRAQRGFANIRETEGWWAAMNTDFSEMGKFATREGYMKARPKVFQQARFRDDIAPLTPDTRFLAPSRGPLSGQRPAPTATPWGPLNNSLNRRALSTSNSFGGMDWSRFTPTAAASDWMKVSAASEVLKENSAAVDVMMKRIAMEYGAAQVRNTRAVALGLEDQAAAAQRILDRLFPQDARNMRYMGELAQLRAERDAGRLSAERFAEAERLLRNEWIASMPAVDAIAKGLSRYVRASDDAARKADVTTVRIARSFADMAQDVMSSIDRLASGVRGGGFLDILSGVIGLGLNLGKSGLFGSSVQTKLMKAPGFATGGSMILGGRSGIDRNLLSLNGAPLARVSAGEKMTIAPANDRASGAGDGVVVVKVEEGALFRPVVASTAGRVVTEASPSIMDGSAKVTTARAARRQSRRL